MRTVLRKEMHGYKRRNQRFDARLSRIKSRYDKVTSSPLKDENGKMFGFVVRFGLNYITSSELMWMTSEDFNRKVK